MCSNEQGYYQSSELETRDQLTAEQEKVKALVDALDQIADEDYDGPAKNVAVKALSAVKDGK